MPPRNLLIIALAIGVCLLCYKASSRNRYANLFAEAMDIVETQALKEVESEALFNSAMGGMLKKLDRYSLYISGDSYQRFDESLRGQFGGIGIYVDSLPDESSLVVLAASPGTPADKAGLTSGDLIVSINGESTRNVERTLAVKKLKGEVGQSLEMEIVRDGETMTKTLTRQVIAVSSVHGDFRDEDSNWVFRLEDYPRIGYIRLRSFGERTDEELFDALESINGKVDGMIIDLRHNSGGLLTSAIRVCDMFLGPDKTIVSTEGRGQFKNELFKSSDQMAVDAGTPVVVLVNRYSASASEIVAGCLQDHGRAVVIGEQSWGKGTVQNIIPIRPNRSALKLTIAGYRRPSGEPIDRFDPKVESSGVWGVRPATDDSLVLSDLDVMRNFQRRDVMDIRTLIPEKQRPAILKLLTATSDAPLPEDADVQSQPEGAEEVEATDLLEWEDRVLRQAIERLKVVPAAQKAA